MEIAIVVLNYLKVFLSAPVIAGAVVLTFFWLFRRETSGVIGRIFRVRFPGGELLASQHERAELDPSVAGRTPTLSQVQEIQVPSGVPLSPTQAQELRQLIQSEHSNALLWEYRFLNLYLVRATQLLLGWLATFEQPVSVHFVDSSVQTHIGNPEERGAMLAALANHHLITVTSERVQVTHKGRDYLQWRGPLLPHPVN